VRSVSGPSVGVGRRWSLAAAALLLAACANPTAPALTPLPTPAVMGSPAAGPSPGAGPAAATPPTAASPVASPSPAPAASTAGALAALGQQVYAQQCAICHGEQGQGLVGPAVIGPRANLGKYATGQGLYDYTQSLMPQNAPGSLSPEQYLQVTGYLLVQNNLVPADAPLSQANLQAVPLER
jgi:mono/diheme cytochrome c family protein